MAAVSVKRSIAVVKAQNGGHEVWRKERESDKKKVDETGSMDREKDENWRWRLVRIVRK